MIKDILKSGFRDNRKKQDNMIALELSEVKDIADIIFSRIEKKIEILQALEASVDAKALELERLIQRAEAVKAPIAGFDRQSEILGLVKRGMKVDEIADILAMPAGEVELIRNLHTQNS